jgi:hypothetical protein
MNESDIDRYFDVQQICPDSTVARTRHAFRSFNEVRSSLRRKFG